MFWKICRCLLVNTSSTQQLYEALDFRLSYLIHLQKKSKCLDTQQPGSVLKNLDARQSEILTNFSRNSSFNSSKNKRRNLMFLGELNELFRENWSKFLTIAMLQLISNTFTFGSQFIKLT